MTNTRLQVIETKNLFSAYNTLANAKTLPEGEIGSDGYTSAYSEIQGNDPSESSTYTGKCTNGTGGTATALDGTTTPTLTTSDWDDTATMTIAFEGDATADSGIGADASDTGGASVCAMKCSSLEYWPVSSDNLPYTYLPDSGTSTLTTTDTAAVSGGLSTMTSAYCLGFEVGASGTANNGDQLTCSLYYGAFPTGNVTETADSTTFACYKRTISD